ncbi:MAG: DUF433 domain-containing protein [Chloroflexi bacterium]|nr:DUF433 domain-containing protein [Chloroflexota bacterium]
MCRGRACPCPHQGGYKTRPYSKPVVQGTRIPVELVLKHLAQNPDLNELFAAYPRLTIEDVRACLEYAQRLDEGDRI